MSDTFNLGLLSNLLVDVNIPFVKEMMEHVHSFDSCLTLLPVPKNQIDPLQDLRLSEKPPLLHNFSLTKCKFCET